MSAWLISCHAHARSWKEISADDPEARERVATNEYSPFAPMYIASYLSTLVAIAALYPQGGSPDWQRDAVEKTSSAAAHIILWSGLLNFYLFSPVPFISPEERAKLGEVSKSEIDRNAMQSRRTSFQFFHALNTAAIFAVGTQSSRSERWLIVGSYLVFPYLVDLSARHVFRSGTVSPWTLTVAPVMHGEKLIPMLALNFPW